MDASALARCGFYAQASRAAEEAADLAATPHEVAISRYMARVYAMWAAVVSGIQEEIAKAFNALRQELPVLQREVAGTAMEVRWGKGHGPVYLLQAFMLAGVEDDGVWAENVAIFWENIESLGGAFEPWFYLLNLGGPHSGSLMREKDSFLASKRVTDAEKAWLHLILAQALRFGGAWHEALDEYLQIKPVPDAHMVAAAAARELAEVRSYLGIVPSCH